MPHFTRFYFYGCSLGLTCFILSFSFHWSQNFFWSKSHLMKQEQTLASRDQLPRDTITPLKDNKTYIIAPYYDHRERNMIRILGIVHHTEVKELYCYFSCANTTVRVKADIDMHQDRFGFPYGLSDIICNEPTDCSPTHVALDSSPTENFADLISFPIQNRNPGSPTASFTVCFSAMFGNYSNVLQFIQTVEMYKILGAQKVMVYLNNCSRQMEEVLQYYTEEGTVEVIPWHIQRYLKVSDNWQYPNDGTEIGYYGQISALNDCIYRNMYSSKFVVLNDQDEIILPFKHRTWDTMMESLQRKNPKVGIFQFENHIFPQTVVSNGNFTNTSSWNRVPGSNLLQYIHREPDRLSYYNARKMILDPRAVIQTSVHSTLKQYKRSMYVPLHTALVYHCRDPLQHNLPRASLIKDRTIWRYNVSLIRNVNQALLKFKLIG
uniref:Glycosyltransferase family 92 protein n=1 Tax=Xenopus tropicalis TaxID=8364 RepID=A0A803JPL4_XENTR